MISLHPTVYSQNIHVRTGSQKTHGSRLDSPRVRERGEEKQKSNGRRGSQVIYFKFPSVITLSHTGEGHYGRWERVKDDTRAAIWLTGANRQEKSEGERAGLISGQSYALRYQCRHAGTKREKKDRNTEGKCPQVWKESRKQRKRERLWLLALELMNVTSSAETWPWFLSQHTHTHTHHGIATQRNHRHSGSKRVYQIKGMFRVQ